MPAVLDKCVRELVAKGMSEQAAYGICISRLQKAGILRKGTLKLTKKGREHE